MYILESVEPQVLRESCNSCCSITRNFQAIHESDRVHSDGRNRGYNDSRRGNNRSFTRSRGSARLLRNFFRKRTVSSPEPLRHIVLSVARPARVPTVVCGRGTRFFVEKLLTRGRSSKGSRALSRLFVQLARSVIAPESTLCPPVRVYAARMLARYPRGHPARYSQARPPSSLHRVYRARFRIAR